MERLRQIRCGEHQVSCSIGAQPITGSSTVDELYRNADSQLYMAKKLGKGQYVIGPAEDTASVVTL